MELTQIRLVVTDFSTVFRYYRDVVGLRPQEGASADGPYAAFKPEQGSTLALHERANLAEHLGGVLGAGTGGDTALISLRVDDLADYLRQATERGAEPLGGIVDFGRLRCSYLRDPEGNLLELQQWATG